MVAAAASPRTPRTRIIPSGWLFLLAASASIFLIASDPEPAEAWGCGRYTECVSNCPTQTVINRICLEHLGPCIPGSGSCGRWGCGWGNSKITCVYEEGGGPPPPPPPI